MEQFSLKQRQHLLSYNGHSTVLSNPFSNNFIVKDNKNKTNNSQEQLTNKTNCTLS